jgi:hypothetical protein
MWIAGGEWQDAAQTVIQRYDLDNGSVTDVGNLDVARARPVGFTIKGSIFVAGGRDPQSRRNDIVRIDPVTNAVTPAGTLPSGLSDAAIAVVNDVAYIIGGATPEPSAAIVTAMPQ